jgi:hypothetical protein
MDAMPRRIQVRQSEDLDWRGKKCELAVLCEVETITVVE